MALATLVDRVKIQVLSSGTGPFQLGAAIPAYRGVEALIDGQTYNYATESGSTYEVGTGLYIAASQQIVRTPILSSAGGSTVAFPANIELVFTALAQDFSPSAAAEAGAAAGASAGETAGASAGAAAAAAVLSGKAQAQALGVAGDANSLGVFEGTIIPDNQTAKEAIQSLETRLQQVVQWVTPEQQASFDPADATAAIQAALDTGKSVLLAGTYFSRGTTLTTDGQVVLFTGTLMKKPGTVAPLFTVIGDNVMMDCAGGTFQDFNRTATATVTAGGTSIALSALSGGTIRWYPQDGVAKGTAVWGPGMLPGTRIIGGPTASGPPHGAGGGAGSYTLDRPQPNDWTGVVWFMDADSFWFGNNTLQIEGENFTCRTPYIFGSAGNGIQVSGGRCRLLHPLIHSATDNSLLAIGPDCGDFLFDTPQCYGSGWQNTIFVVAGDQTPGSPNYTHGGTIHNPTGLYAGDTALEIGWHAKDINVTGCARLDSYNAPVLIRDALNPFVEAAIVYSFMPHSPDWSAIAVVPSTEPVSWKTGGSIENVRYFGKPERAFAYVGQCDVTILGCLGDTGQATPLNYAACAFFLAGQVSNVDVRGNKMKGFIDAVRTNTLGAQNTIDGMNIQDNQWINVTRALDGGSTTFTASRSVGNKVVSSEYASPYNLVGAIITPAGSPAAPSLLVYDQVAAPAVSGGDVPIYQFDPRTLTTSGLATDPRTACRANAETQTSIATLADIAAIGGQLIRVWLSDGSEFAVYMVDGNSLTTTKIAGTTNMKDSSDFGGSTGWALGNFFGALAFRRNGTNTGVTGRFVMWCPL